MVLGYLRFLRWQLPLHFVIAPRASRGELALDFVSGQVGPIGLPELLFDPLGNALARVILAGQAFAEVTQISVREGELTIAGRYNRHALEF
jgi:hypothetical protein